MDPITLIRTQADNFENFGKKIMDMLSPNIKEKHGGTINQRLEEVQIVFKTIEQLISSCDHPNQKNVSTKTTLVGSSNGSINEASFEESDDEVVQLLLSMKKNVFNCKCGEYLNSITDWDEHQKICPCSSEKNIGKQCPLCKKTFLSCVALNIHCTKKHNKKKMRTDSVMHCPCGQTFTAKWRQNCVHKLNSHGRDCKAFKVKEIQCDICKKGFIERKSLEYHGLKAHGLAVPVNS
ncbi:uncharacterized protein LOC107362888 [Tetranychus urticae]|uniref:C2H2-type domain-containing protein n=1 Tax=Tetranychus urticae TaxID=32264 RepID=T1KD45_TETUR|nr:uncharacterized protein LOC107362888 [Tetranychus urticae]